MDNDLQKQIQGFNKKKLSKQVTVDKSAPAIGGSKSSHTDSSSGGGLPPRSGKGTNLFGGVMPQLPKKGQGNIPPPTFPKKQGNIPPPTLPKGQGNIPPPTLPKGQGNIPPPTLPKGQGNIPPPTLPKHGIVGNRPLPNNPPSHIKAPPTLPSRPNPPPPVPSRPSGMTGSSRPLPGAPKPVIPARPIARDDSAIKTSSKPSHSSKPFTATGKSPPRPKTNIGGSNVKHSAVSSISITKRGGAKAGDYGPKSYLRFTFDLNLPPPPPFKNRSKIYSSRGSAQSIAPISISTRSSIASTSTSSTTTHIKSSPSITAPSSSNSNNPPLPPPITKVPTPDMPRLNKAPSRPIPTPGGVVKPPPHNPSPSPQKKDDISHRPPPPKLPPMNGNPNSRPPPPNQHGNPNHRPPPPNPNPSSRPLPPKPLKGMSEIDRLKKELNDAIAARKFELCAQLRNRIAALEAGDDSSLDISRYNAGKMQLEDKIQECARNMNFELCVGLKNKLQELVNFKKQYDNGDANVVPQINTILSSLNN